MEDTSGCHVAEGPGSKARISLACSDPPSAHLPFARDAVLTFPCFQPDRPHRAEADREEKMQHWTREIGHA